MLTHVSQIFLAIKALLSLLPTPHSLPHYLSLLLSPMTFIDVTMTFLV